MRVLLIDDEPMVTHYYVEAMRRSGHVVDYATSSSEALSLVQRHEAYDAIIQDIMRPPDDAVLAEESDHGLNTGIVFYEKHLKARCPATPIIFLSNSAMFDRDRGRSDPLCTYLQKLDVPPFALADIVSAVVEKVLESLYEHVSLPISESTASPILTDIRSEIAGYFARHPEKLYSIAPRRFEELVADVLHAMGFDVELTKATRDGGVDIFAYLRHEVATFMMIVECKRNAPHNPVGIDVVQRLYGIQNTRKANKSMIVTTSYFSSPARDEARQYGGLMDLRDYEDLKSWLRQYASKDSMTTGWTRAAGG